MCLIFLAYEVHPEYPLVVAANRDEFFKRADVSAAFWSDYPQLLAGKDLQQGGTWMGITMQGRFSALTNYRDPSRLNPNAPSRGHLVQNFLTCSLNPEAYIESIQEQCLEYNGFNLLAGGVERLYYYSNREMKLQRIEPGIHGLSNSLLNTPWPKVTNGIQAISAELGNTDIDIERIFSVMADREQPADQDLPKTGVSLEMERMLGPIRIVNPEYGTKSTTVLMISRSHQVRFWERSFSPDQLEPWNQVYYEFQLHD